MPQGPGGAGGQNLPGVQASFINAVMEAKGFKSYNAAKNWVYNQINQGKTIDQIAKAAGLNAGATGPDGGPPVFTGGGGGSGGSGGSGSVGPDPAALRAAYVGILHSWGIPAGKVAGLVNQAVNGNWTSSQFVNHLRLTKAYNQAFHGINSQPGLTESSYLALFRQFKAKAQDIGHGLSRNMFGTLLKNGVDYQEWSYRVKAEELIDKNGPLFNWYERELRRRGDLKANEQLKRKDLWDIVTKQNSKKFESIYQTAYLSANLQKIGFDLFAGAKGGPGKDITRKDILKLINQFETGGMGQEVENLRAEDFAQLAEQIRTTIPASQLYGYGLKKRDLLELKLGGPNAQRIAATAKSALRQAEAATQDRSASQLVQTEKGTKLLTGGLSGDEGY
jgi:hypothetical protein